LKKRITGLLCFTLPSFLLRYILRFLGHKIGQNAKIGFSFLFVKEIEINENAIIGHFNLFLNDKIILNDYSLIGYLNIFKGPFTLNLKQKAAIGNKNYITRARLGVTYGDSALVLGELTKVTVGHHLDLTRSIIFGDFSILAGIRSQLWTHGYYHSDTGSERVRIDGEIIIGNNVYVGSGCIFNPGVTVASAIHIGGGSVISKDLEKPGMYVGQRLRHIENDLNKIKGKLKKIDNDNLIEPVYTKK
jgi:acetyltransferase-like isoleucine patch superfamily enzyme